MVYNMKKIDSCPLGMQFLHKVMNISHRRNTEPTTLLKRQIERQPCDYQMVTRTNAFVS